MSKGGDRGGRKPTLPPDQKRANIGFRLPAPIIDRLKAEAASQGTSVGKRVEGILASRY